MNFNPIASFYDILADIVFFRQIYLSQCCYLDKIPPRSNILVIGGGTGRFLKKLLLKNTEYNITYV
jgi:tRNA (cmo5U34)-methyltransferase